MIVPPRAKWILRGAVLLFFVICLLPILVMLVDSLRVDGRFSAAAYRSVLGDRRQWTLLWNTVALGLLGSAWAVALGLPYAWFVSRTDVPLRRIFGTLYVAPLLTPPLILAWGWTRTPAWLGLSHLQGLPGTAFVFALCYYPFVTLMASRAFRSLDAGLEEAGRLLGGPLASFFRVTCRLALPSILAGALLAFLFIISDFALPDFISTLGPKLNVYAGEIFFRAKRLDSSAEATAASLPLLVLTAVVLLLILRLRGRRSYAVLSGDFRPPRTARLGFWRWPAGLFCLLVLGASVLAPFTVLLEKAGGLESFRKAVSNPGAREDIVNSVVTSAIGATAMAALGLLLAYAIVRGAGGRRWRTFGLESLTVLPLAVPSVMLGVGLIRLWNRPEWPFDAVYTSKVIVILVYVARYIPFPVLALAGSLRQIDPGLEEAGALAGVPFRRRFARIVLPLVRRGLVAGWILGFAFSMRELDTMVLIPEGNATLPFRVFNEIHFGRDPEIAAISLILVFLIALPLLLHGLLARRRLEIPSA